jgi:hypothetical protein
LFGYLTAKIRGSGSMGMSTVRPNAVTQSSPNPSHAARTLDTNPLHDLEWLLNEGDTQIGIWLITQSANTWFSVKRLALYRKPFPSAAVRGHNL